VIHVVEMTCSVCGAPVEHVALCPVTGCNSDFRYCAEHGGFELASLEFDQHVDDRHDETSVLWSAMCAGGEA
jgi:hypothetical protein